MENRNSQIQYRQWTGNMFHYWGFAADGCFEGPAAGNDGQGIYPSELSTGHYGKKRGVLIFEGDIVKINEGLARVAWSGTEFFFDTDGLKNTLWFDDWNIDDDDYRMTIVGNVHEEKYKLFN